MSNLFDYPLGVTDDVLGVFLGVTDDVFHGDATWKFGPPGDFVVTALYFFRRCSEINIRRTFFFDISVITYRK